jgi:hypothetical protein
MFFAEMLAILTKTFCAAKAHSVVVSRNLAEFSRQKDCFNNTNDAYSE